MEFITPEIAKKVALQYFIEWGHDVSSEEDLVVKDHISRYNVTHKEKTSLYFYCSDFSARGCMAGGNVAAQDELATRLLRDALAKVCGDNYRNALLEQENARHEAAIKTIMQYGKEEENV